MKPAGLNGRGLLPFLIVALALMATTACSSSKPQQGRSDSEAMTIVFVHGAWGGGWQFAKVQPLLEAEGHSVLRPTMTGLGERVHLAAADVGLSTHIEDIVNVLEFEDLHQIVLVGHSYGGMVITGVAERVPERIRTLVYLDAILPEEGESVSGLFGDAIDSMATAGAGDAEAWQLVPRWVEAGKPPPVDVPQPLLTFTEEIVIDNPEATALHAVYILTVEKGEDSDNFGVFADRARSRGWQVVVMEGGHNPHWFQPENFVDVLQRAVQN